MALAVFKTPDSLSLECSLCGVTALFLFLLIRDKSSPNTSPVLNADINSSNSPTKNKIVSINKELKDSELK